MNIKKRTEGILKDIATHEIAIVVDYDKINQFEEIADGLPNIDVTENGCTLSDDKEFFVIIGTPEDLTKFEPVVLRDMDMDLDY